MSKDKTSTSISIDKKLWKRFMLWVFIKDGNRKASMHVERAIREYLDSKQTVNEDGMTEDEVQSVLKSLEEAKTTSSVKWEP